jgi:hypothetical protein
MYADLLKDIVDFHDDVVRNIKGIRASQNLFDDLSDDRDDQVVAVAAESADRIPSEVPLITRPFDYGAVITYPFEELNNQGTRFSDGLHYGVWYGSLELETTVYETVYHWHAFIADCFSREDQEIVGERRVFHARCDAILLDMRGKEHRERRLLDRHNYDFTQHLGRYIKGQNQNGLLIRSARCRGTNADIFSPGVLSRVRDLCFLTYRMNPTKDLVRVERTLGRNWLEIRPSRLQ